MTRLIKTRRRFARHGEARGRRGGRTLATVVVMSGAWGLLLSSSVRISVASDASLAATRDYWNAVAIDSAGDLVTAGVSLYRGDWHCEFVLAKTVRSSGAVVWRRDVPDCGEDETYESSGEEQVVIDPAGDIVVGRRDIGERSFSAYKFSGANGETLWRQTIGPVPKHGPFVHAVSLDAAGNVVAGAGLRVPLDLTTVFTVVKLEAATGAELWRQSLRGTFVADDDDEALNQAISVVVDGAGDVIANGSLIFRAAACSPAYQGIVLKLSGHDGAEIWRGETSLRPTEFYTEERLQSSLAVDSEGDVVITGAGIGPDFRRTLTVEKLSGVNGARLWRHAVAEPGTDVLGLALTVDVRDEIAAMGIRRTFRNTVPDDSGIVLLKLTGDGNERWRREIDGTAPRGSLLLPFGGDQPLGLTTDAEGNVVLAGGIENAESGVDFLLAGFAGNTGDRLWPHELDGTASDDGNPDGPCLYQRHGLQCDQARGVAIDAESVVAVGSLDDDDTGPDAVTVVLSVATGAEAWRVTTSGPLPEDQVCEVPGGRPCGDGTTDQPSTTTTAPSPGTATTSTTTTGATSTTLPGGISGPDCDDGDPCTTSDRRVGAVCAGTVVGIPGVACAADRLASELCGEERLPRKLRRSIDTGVKRTRHLLDKVMERDAAAKTGRWRRRARTQLEAIARSIAKLTTRPSMRPRLSAACLDEVDGLAMECRELATQLGAPP